MYGKFNNNILVQKQPNKEAGFIEIPDDLVCGAIKDGKGFKYPKPEANKLSYKQLRAAEYPDIGDQLDAIMKWLSTEGEFAIPKELKSIAMTCMSVKAKYPKPKE